MKDKKYYFITSDGLKLMSYLLHPDKREDCACLHKRLLPHQRCFNCRDRKLCNGEVERDSCVCNYIRYHHELPNDADHHQ